MIDMTSKNLRLVLLGLLGLSVIVFLAVFSIGLSSLASKSKAMVDLKVKSQTAELQLSTLEQSKKEIEKYSYFKDVAKTVIPNDKNQAQTVLDIFQIADSSGIQIQTITFPASSLGTGTSSPTAQDATSPSSTKTAISQATPVTSIPGLYSLQLTIQPSDDNNTPANKRITYPKMLDFLSRIERDRRTAQISQITIEPSGINDVVKFSLVINTFIKP